MEYSQYQNDIFEAMADKKESLEVQAVAGSGKTTTMVAGVSRLPKDESHLALAFNKQIATTLQQRMPGYIDARTFNSLGFRTLIRRKHFEHDNNKCLSILKQVMPTNYHEDYLYDVKNILTHGKAWGVGYFAPNEESTWGQLVDDDRFDLPADVIARVIPWLTKAMERSIDDDSKMDFNDQILMPLIYGLRPAQYSTISVDESQDLSPLQHEFLAQCLTPSGRVFAFGDSHQAIYGFRGADVRSMQSMARMFNMEPYPLSISYRCPRTVIELAQRFVPYIEAAPAAHEGIVEDHEIFPGVSFFNSDDLVLCRNNAPLIKLGMQFLLAKVPVNVRSNFGRPLLKFIRDFKTDDKSIFLKRLASWHETEASAAENDEKWGKLNRINEKYEAIVGIAEAPEVKTVKDVLKALGQLLEPGRGTTLSTVHKAKGEEADRVFIYSPDLMPSKYAKDEESLQQERNLQYVAITRALKELHFIPAI